MDDGFGNIKVIPDHFQVSTPPKGDSLQNRSSPDSQPSTGNSSRIGPVAVHVLEKVQLTVAELESLRSELANIEEREAHLRAQLEHIDEILRSARLAGYLYIRTRWAALPGEPALVDDTDVDDWLPRFIVLHGQCIFFYLFSTDLSPQDSTLLSDVVEVGSLPSFIREDEGTQYAFYILTRQGLRYECSHFSKVQVDTWLSALQTDCKLGSGVKVSNGL
ncbi:hypothetical protein V6N11_011019 [Hibiscus sabdariffa]|uniref:PH domain-containing protein n=1 Tax=Hibiscus sabdariffa TaxID=183260 RepID=A0ABR2S7R3_9ROSI